MTVPALRSTGIQLLADLESAGAITPTSLTLDDLISYDQYESLAAMCGLLHRTSAWLIGDLLNYGERVYGETYVQAAEATGLAVQTCLNYASVAHRVAPERRRQSLSFAVHEEVAALEPVEQEKWLKQAERKQWTRSQLREARRELPSAVELCRCSVCGNEHRVP